MDGDGEGGWMEERQPKKRAPRGFGFAVPFSGRSEAVHARCCRALLCPLAEPFFCDVIFAATL